MFRSTMLFLVAKNFYDRPLPSLRSTSLLLSRSYCMPLFKINTIIGVVFMMLLSEKVFCLNNGGQAIHRFLWKQNSNCSFHSAKKACLLILTFPYLQMITKH